MVRNEDELGGAISRRRFLRGGAAGLALAPVSASLLAACSADGGRPEGAPRLRLAAPDNPVTLPLADTNQAIASGLQPEQGATLKLYNWDQYIWKKVVDDFAEKYDCNFEISTYNNQEEAISKLRSGQTDFDIFFPTVSAVGRLALTEMIQPLNHDYLPNLKNVWPQFSDRDRPFYDRGQRYTVPYTVYRTGIGYLTTEVAEKDQPQNLANPYEILWNPDLRGKVSVYDDYREALGMALLRNGFEDINTGDSEALAAARDALIECAEATNMALTINGAYEDLPKGIFWAAQAWSGDMIAAPWYGEGSFDQTAAMLGYWWPQDHTGVIGNDCLAILKSARNPVLAHLFLDHMLDFDTSMRNFSWVGYQPPQKDAPPEAFKDPSFKYAHIVPRNLLDCLTLPEDFDAGKQYLEIPTGSDAIWQANWEQVTAGL